MRVKKLKRTRTVLWAVGCKEKVWGYTGGDFDRHTKEIRGYVANAFLEPDPSGTSSVANAPSGSSALAANAPGMKKH